MFVSNSFLNSTEPYDNDKFRKHFKNVMGEIISEFFSDKPLFSDDKIKLYYYDEFEFDTSVTLKTKNTLYLEINQPDNIKKWIQKKNKHTYPELYYPFKNLKSDLFEFCLNQFDSNTYISIDKFGLNFSINIFNDEEEENVENYNFKVIPCIIYKNENDVEGVMYFNEDTKDFIIEYPHLAIANFKKKNKQTFGLYKGYVVMFKNIIRQLKNERDMPSEIFETIVYNVPNVLFENYSLENVQRIINYIRNSNLYNYKTLDEQDFSFITLYRPLNIVYVKHVIKRLESYLKKVK